MERITLFADVILPLSVPGYYTYRVPLDLNNAIEPGSRVIVQFGKNKKYTGVVRSVHQNAPKNYQSKYIEAIVDHSPLFNEVQMKFMDWVSAYYMAYPGEVLNAALPSGLKLSSETRIQLYPERELDQELTDQEKEIIDLLEDKKQLSLSDLKSLDVRNFYPFIRSLLDKRQILFHEDVIEKFKVKLEPFVKLGEFAAEDDNLKEILDDLEKKAFKQLEMVLAFIHLSGRYSGSDKEVSKAELLSKGSPSALTALVDKGIFEIYNKRFDRIKSYTSARNPRALNNDQLIAFQEIQNAIEANVPVLFHGVTSSGKTEVYIHLIQQALEKNSQVLYLLPEIALTTQIINRLREIFGNRVGVYHSRFNDSERVEIWEKTNKDFNFSSEEGSHKYDIVLGARSSLFLPFKNLGLIIVDEEHDSSFKQQDPSPRYNARDSALMLARMNNASIILGSATPSVESYFNARNGKYRLVNLSRRFSGVELPEIKIADMKLAYSKKEIQSSFSPLLLEEIRSNLSRDKQVILFRNRRGFAPLMECRACGVSVACENCDVSLSYHKAADILKCHLCGFQMNVPVLCPACHSPELFLKGYGTERIEEELELLFPDVRIERMDLDTTRTKNSYLRIINEFEDRKIKILVGTQMLTKGLDFDNVGLVGIISADSMISFPDFRSHEKSFQQMIQVSGRAGRKLEKGTVVIQAYNTAHPVIEQVINHDYEGMYNSVISDRKSFGYPPFTRLIGIYLRHKDKFKVDDAGVMLAAKLRDKLGNRVLGPEYPLIMRVKNYYIKHIVIKAEKDMKMDALKKFIYDKFIEMKTEPGNSQLYIYADVDPVF